MHKKCSVNTLFGFEYLATGSPLDEEVEEIAGYYCSHHYSLLCPFLFIVISMAATDPFLIIT